MQFTWGQTRLLTTLIGRLSHLTSPPHHRGFKDVLCCCLQYSSLYIEYKSDDIFMSMQLCINCNLHFTPKVDHILPCHFSFQYTLTTLNRSLPTVDHNFPYYNHFRSLFFVFLLIQLDFAFTNKIETSIKSNEHFKFRDMFR